METTIKVLETSNYSLQEVLGDLQHFLEYEAKEERSFWKVISILPTLREGMKTLWTIFLQRYAPETVSLPEDEPLFLLITEPFKVSAITFSDHIQQRLETEAVIGQHWTLITILKEQYSTPTWTAVLQRS